MTRVSVTESEMLEAVKKFMGDRPAGEEGATIVELSEAHGCSTETMRRVVKDMLIRGLASVVKVQRPRMDGATTTVSGYRLKK